MNRFSTFFLTAAATFSLSAFAAEFKEFTDKALSEAQAAGSPIVVEFNASWCSTCKKQEKVLKDVLQDKKFEKFVVFKADYDKEKALITRFKVIKQSTLVVLKGDKEIERATGITSEKDIVKLVSAGL